MSVLFTALIRITHSKPNYHETYGWYLIRSRTGSEKQTQLTWRALPYITKLMRITFQKLPRSDENIAGGRGFGNGKS